MFSGGSVGRKGDFVMSKKLVAYFSASGVTKKTAEALAEPIWIGWIRKAAAPWR